MPEATHSEMGVTGAMRVEQALRAQSGHMVALTQQEIDHVAAWLLASTVPMRGDDPGLLDVWLRTPVGSAYSKLKELASE